jgi:hypothetical protein
MIGVWLILIISYDLLKDKSDFLILIKYLSFSILIVCLLGDLEVLTGLRISNLIFKFHLTNLDEKDFFQFAGGTDFYYRGGFPRIESTYTHSIFLGIALTFMLPILLFNKVEEYKTLFKLTILVSIITAFFTFSRTAWLGILVPFIVNTKKNIFLSVFIISFILFIGLPFLNKDFSESGYAKSSLSLQNRTILLDLVFSEVSFKTLIMGVGLTEVNSEEKFNFIEALPNDNSFAQYLFTRGILGTIMFLFSFLFLINQLRKNMKNLLEENKKLVKSILMIIYIQLAIYFISNSIFQEPRIWFVLFALIGLVLNILDFENQRLNIMPE